MAHPLMFDPDDPYLARVRDVCLSLPGSAEKISHGRPNFFTTKVFASYGGSRKGEQGWVRYERSVLFLPDPPEREALVADPRIFVPGYIGVRGWLGLDLAAARGLADVDWDEVAELVDASYRNTAGARLVQELDRG